MIFLQNIAVLFIFLTIIPVLHTVSSQSAFTTYYVDSRLGNDANSGTNEALPWKTLEKVKAHTYKPGDFVLLKKGSVWNSTLSIQSSGALSNPITISTYGVGDKPRIDVSKKGIFTWTQHTGNVWMSTIRDNIISINNQTALHEKSVATLDKPYEFYKDEETGTGNVYVFAPSSPATYYGDTFQAGDEAYGIQLQNVKFVEVKDVDVFGAKHYGVYIANGDSIGLSNLSVRNPYLTGIRIVNSKNVTVQKSTIVNGYEFGIQAISTSADVITSGIKIIDNTVSGFAYIGIALDGYSGTSRITDSEVSGNASFNNGDGVYLHYSQNSIVSNNDLHDNRRIESYGEGYGVGIQTGSNNTVEGNVMQSNLTDGIEIWGGMPTATKPKYGISNGNKVLRNRIYKNTRNGVHLSSDADGVVDDTVIAYNLIYQNTQRGILIAHAGNTGTKIINNTTYNNGAHTLWYYQSSKPEVKNNLFGPGNSVVLYSDSVTGNNGFAGAPLKWNGVEVANNQIQSKNASFVVSAADFVDVVNEDFGLKQNSPFINKGINAGYTQDIRGRVITGTPDMGAYEYTSSLHYEVSTTTTPGLTQSGGCALKSKGDSNCDGRVTALDLEVWRSEYIREAETKQADFDGSSTCKFSNGAAKFVCLTDLEIILGTLRQQN